MEELAKHIAIGAGIGIGADYIVEKVGRSNNITDAFNQGNPSLIQKFLYGGGALLSVLGLIGGKDSYEYIPIGLSMIAGTWLYEHYLAMLLGVRKTAYQVGEGFPPGMEIGHGTGGSLGQFFQGGNQTGSIPPGSGPGGTTHPNRSLGMQLES
jgi:hypothetical protein